jgi:uncharacterized protein (TIGR00375 family)
LDNISLISNSDAHSLQKIGREANVFDCEVSYNAIIEAIKSRDPKKFLYTIEFFPEEGKYHYDGHKDCGICFSPEQTKKHHGKCPKCGKNLIIGVLNRIEKLSDRKIGDGPANPVPFKSFVPLDEIIGKVLGVGPKSKSVITEYEKLISNFGSEFYVLMDADCCEIARISGFRTAEAVKRVRQGKIRIKPGYDGEYGKISIFEEEEEEIEKPQASLF